MVCCSCSTSRQYIWLSGMLVCTAVRYSTVETGRGSSLGENLRRGVAWRHSAHFFSALPLGGIQEAGIS